MLASLAMSARRGIQPEELRHSSTTRRRVAPPSPTDRVLSCTAHASETRHSAMLCSWKPRSEKPGSSADKNRRRASTGSFTLMRGLSATCAGSTPIRSAAATNVFQLRLTIRTELMPLICSRHRQAGGITETEPGRGALDTRRPSTLPSTRCAPVRLTSSPTSRRPSMSTKWSAIRTRLRCPAPLTLKAPVKSSWRSSVTPPSPHESPLLDGC